MWFFMLGYWNDRMSSLVTRFHRRILIIGRQIVSS